MIELTRLNKRPVMVNILAIATVEATPDTMLTLLGGERILVLETPEEVAERTLQFLRSIPRVQSGEL